MRSGRGVLRIGLAFVALLASLTLVVWRQSRTLDTLRGLDAVRREVSLAESERADLVRRIQALESRARVVAEAGRRLGMRVPNGGEIVILPGGIGTPATALAFAAPPGRPSAEAGVRP